MTTTQQSPETFVKAHLVDALGVAGIVVLALTNRISGPVALGAILSIVGARTSIAAWKILRFVINLLGVGGGGIDGPNGPPGSMRPPSPPSLPPKDDKGPPSTALYGGLLALKWAGKRAATIPASVLTTMRGGQ